jgi:hypothetical protein
VFIVDRGRLVEAIVHYSIVNLQAKIYPQTVIYGGSNKAPALTNLVKDKDEINFGEINIKCGYIHPFSILIDC